MYFSSLAVGYGKYANLRLSKYFLVENYFNISCLT